MKTSFKPRRFDKERGCYVYDISFKTGTRLTERTAKVAEAFGIGADTEKEYVLLKDFELKLSEGDIVYITGESGSGKSVLFRALKEDLGEKAIDLSEVVVDSGKPIVETIGIGFKEAIRILSRVGLNDAYLFIRRYPELSEGQKYRYRMACIIDSGKKFWLADEFCSNLDRTTAKIVAYNIQRQARQVGTTLIVATSHGDLEEDLAPTIIIKKSWGSEVKIEYRKKPESVVCTAVKNTVIRRGSHLDYDKLSWLHYRESKLMAPLRIYAAEIDGELAGVITYSYPGINASGRRKAVGYRPNIQEINTNWAVVSRVIVHPKYRSTGLGCRLLRDTLTLVGRKHVELIAVMAEYNPFAEHAGMRHVTFTTPHQYITKTIQALATLGFEPQLMASTNYNIQTLSNFSTEEVDNVRKLLLGVGRNYYKRIGSFGRPYATKAEMEAWLKAQPTERLSKCIQNLAVLGQSKAYLYWCRDWLIR